MRLPVTPPVDPMLARNVDRVPRTGELLYEPKWDGFRCLVFRDGDVVELASRNKRPLTRYFPELLPPLRERLPDRCCVDGEVVIVTPDGLDWDALTNRIHPAASRVGLLARETPASYVAFDLLALGGRDLRDEPLAERRRLIEEALAAARAPIHLTPATTDPDVAEDWFERFEGAGLDGIIAKRLDEPYLEGKRGWWKVKHDRTADVVVAGFRRHKDGAGVGSLLLGLYDDAGNLQHVGVASAFKATQRRELVEQLAPYQVDALEGHPWAAWADPAAHEGQRLPGGQSRWTGTRDLSWEPLRPELVCEVAFNQLEGDRFRHPATFLRWRPDRDTRSCTYAQLEVAVPEELSAVFGA